MTSATDELRRLLDERGVEWVASGTDTCWTSADGYPMRAWDTTNGTHMRIADLTPEQVIAATLGRGTLTAEDVRSFLNRNSVFDDTTWTHGTQELVFDEDDLQAMADELNGTLGRGTCEFTVEYDRDEVERRRKMYEENPLGLFPQDMPPSAWTCSNCGQQYKCHYDRHTGNLLPIPDWMKCCPNCGCEVVDA